jgi:hypothetical protein
VSDIWQQEKNLKKAAKILGESKSQLHARESTAKTKVCEEVKRDEEDKKRANFDFFFIIVCVFE